MFAASSEEKSHDGPGPTCPKVSSRSKVNKKAQCARASLPPLCQQPPSLAAVLVSRPLFSHTPVLRNIPSDQPLSMKEFPCRVTQLGQGRAFDDKKNSEEPHWIASDLRSHIPDRITDALPAQSAVNDFSLAGQSRSIKVTSRKDKFKPTWINTNATKQNKPPLSGTDVVEIFAKTQDLREKELYYLKEVDTETFRPYDLQVVDFRDTGSEHYIFSPSSVLHVTEQGYGGLLSLAEWCRESRLWRALQEIQFFRDFRLHKAFAWWNRNVRRIIFQRKCKDLQDVLLIAVPQFRDALLLFSRIIEELRTTLLLPQEEYRSYTLLEFKEALITMNHGRRQILETLAQCRGVLLNQVKEDSYNTHRQLLLHIEYANKPNQNSEPIYLHVAHQQELKEALSQSQSVLEKLGRFAALINQITVQSLVMVVHKGATSFRTSLCKRKTCQRCCLFHTEMRFSANNQLSVEPMIDLFQQAVSQALLRAGDSVIQMCEKSGLFEEIGNSAAPSDFTDSAPVSACFERLPVAGQSSRNDGMSGCRMFCCRRMLGEAPPCPLLQTGNALLPVHGKKVHGCYYPLTRQQLEWQLSVNDFPKQVEKEQNEFMREAGLEIHQLCEKYSWLADIHAFTCQWNPSSLEPLLDQPASLYDEHVKMLRHWTQRISTVPSTISSSNLLFTVHCTHIKENLGRQLKLVEDEVYHQLVEQIKLHTESVLSDLEKATTALRSDPKHLHDFSKYARMVKESAKMLAATQRRVNYILSLQETLHKNYREMTKEEMGLEEKMLAMWNSFIPLLREADEIVCCSLPSLSKTIDSMFSLLLHELENVVSEASSGPFLDPRENSDEMVSKLSHMHVHVHKLGVKLEQLSRDSQNLKEIPVDLTILATGVKLVEARKELWELIAESTAWIEACQELHVCENVASQAQLKLANWKEKALSLTSAIPAEDAVMQKCLRNLEHLNHNFGIMVKLQSPILKQKHLRAIGEGTGLLYEPGKKVTVAEMFKYLEGDSVIIDEVCKDAQSEYNMEQTFEKLQRDWETRLLQVEQFTLPAWQRCETPRGLTQTARPAAGAVPDHQPGGQQSCVEAAYIISGVEEHFGRIESDVMSLSAMLESPHGAGLRPQMEDWLKSLQDLETLLDLFRRYQQTWIFLTKVFNGHFVAQRMDLLHQFLPVDKTFKGIVHFISSDPHVLNFVHCNKSRDLFHGSGYDLYQVITTGLSRMEAISNQLMNHRDAFCGSFPRLWLLSDREMIQLLSSPTSPVALQPFVRKCFNGAWWLEVDGERLCPAKDVDSCETMRQGHGVMKVLGIFGSLQERITFRTPVEPDPSVWAWLCAFEEQLKTTMEGLMRRCFASLNQPELLNCSGATVADPGLPVLELLHQYPLQCLLVAEEAAWRNIVLQAFQENSPMKLSNVNARSSEKLKSLGRILREHVVSKYTATCVCALLQLTLKQAQQVSQLMEADCVPLESSFQWVRLLKYRINPEESNDDATCHVDVLGRCLKYDYEYYGPEDWVMVHTPSTDRATLGILLALTSHRCGFLRGPSMSGKKNTAVHLGKALGRHVHIMQCSPNVTFSVVQRTLSGALQAGAWLVLDSVDSLSHGVLSTLGEDLADIYHCFSGLKGNNRKTGNREPEERSTGPTRFPETDLNLILGGKHIHANHNFGCVVIASSCSSEVPESLRTASRAVALTPPDVRIIAEVMLTSFGFSDAMSLSRRLVSLLSLTKDSLCLPDFIADNQGSYLVLLQKTIRASVFYLQQSLRPGHSSDEDAKKPSKCSRSHLSVTGVIKEEAAIARGILSVWLPLLYEQKRASQFNLIFEDVFPISCHFPPFQQGFEEDEKNQLTDALSEELQRKSFYCDPETTHSVLTLYQTIKSSKAVMLLGPSGSGKTTCFSVLAASLSRLAAAGPKGSENDSVIKGDCPQTTASGWAAVDTMVLFPNAMTHEEIFGCFCEQRGWQDGAIAKVLRNLGQDKLTSSVNDRNSNQTPVMKWLVLDGNPVGQPGWLDYLTTIYSSQEPSLCLPSGEILPSHSHLKLLMEATDLADAGPSAVTRCSLLYFPGARQWENVWKSEINALSFEHELDQRTLEMWNHLADDLFSSTLSLLRENKLTSAIHNERESSKNLSYGLPEVMSFVRILRGLLQYLGKSVMISKIEKDKHKKDAASMNSRHKHELCTRSSFLFAYIWGFGGHLHPCHWTKFDLLARQVLLTCRFRIVVPDNENVFEHFFNYGTKICPTVMHMNKSIAPKGSYTFLLNLMLESNQPVLLAGEPSSGKTTLCKGFLRFSRKHISLPASPLLSSRDLLAILQSYQKPCNGTAGAVRKQPRFILFMDDLHEAPCDVHGKTSAALETLRQSISKGQIPSFDSYQFRLLSSARTSFLTTCCVFGMGNHHSSTVSTRLSRLFSVFVLPGQSIDVILSVHSPWLKHWLEGIPIQQNIEGIASCVITATKTLYRAVCERFQPSPQRPHFIFSHHDLQKVFSGLCLWQPSTQNSANSSSDKLAPDFSRDLATTLQIAHVWMHECLRTFGDRLCSDDERRALVSLISETASVHFGITALEVCGEEPPNNISHAMNSPPTDNQQANIEILPRRSKPADRSDPVTVSDLSPLAGHDPPVEEILNTNSLHVLQHMQSRLDTIVFGPDLSVPGHEQQHFKCSYQEQDGEVVLQRLRELIKREPTEENCCDAANKCDIVHRQRMEQLLHILRALLIPGGHGVLISSGRGTGRKTTVRLAARVAGYQLMEVHPGNQNKLHDILKEAANQTRVGDVNVIILVHEGISHNTRDELLVAMAHGSYPGLHTDEELRELVSRATEVKNSQRYLMDSWVFDKFLSQIHKNIHLFLLLPLNMSDSSSRASNATHGSNAQLAKSLSFSCCVEMYQPWSTESLEETAAQFIQHSPIKIQQEGLTSSLYVAMAGIHQSASQYASVLLSAPPFSPQTYIEFLVCFENLYKHLQDHRESRASRVSSVLSHLDDMKNAAAQYKEHIIRLQEKVAETQQQRKELLRTFEGQKRLLERACEACSGKKNELNHLEEQINHMVQQGKPEFLSGMKILSCLNPSDLDEVRHYRDPPDGVVKILDAICLLFNRPLGWESVKQLLGQSNFFQDLEFFDRSAVTSEQLQQLSHIVNSPLFVPESVREVSKACESLCRWVQAVYECCCMQNHVLANQPLEVLARDVRIQLCLAKEQKDDIYRRVEDVKQRLQLLHADLEDQLLELHSAQNAEMDAVGAFRQLETHVALWRATAKESDLSYQTLPGDALMLSAIISYLGPFGPDVRIELLNKWRELCHTGSIDINPKDARLSVFGHSEAAPSKPSDGFAIPVSERLQLPVRQALAINQESPSTRAIVKVLLWGCENVWAQRWPLLADTQQHLHIRSQSYLITGEGARAELESETECGMVLCADHPELLDKLDWAAEKGLRVLLSRMERAVPSPELLSRLMRATGCQIAGARQCLQPTHPDFRLFLSTQLPTSLLSTAIHPSILAQVRVVDLSLSTEEILELMLTQLLPSVYKQQLIQHLQLQNDKQLLQDKLVSEVNALMKYILQSEASLLQDHNFLPRMAVCQEAVNKLQAGIQQLTEELEYHKSSMAVPRQLMRLAVALYQALQQVSRLSPSYYFTLNSFITVLQEAFVSGRPSILFVIEKMPDGITPDVTQQMIGQLLVQYRPRLSQSHFAVLKLLVSVALLQHQQLCSEAERLSFLKGLQDIEHTFPEMKQTCNPQSTYAPPSWIPSRIHPELTCLEQIPSFRGLIEALSTSPMQWQEYLHLPSSTVAVAVPCPTHTHLSLLQRALLWKTIIPEGLEGLCDAMADLCLPGQTRGSDDPHIANPKALCSYLFKHRGPIILTRPNSREEKSVQPLHLINQLSCYATNTKEVMVVSFGRLWDTEVILSLLDKAVNDGHWLVFNCCHLLERWDIKLVAQLNEVMSRFREEGSLINPNFRMWFITQECAPGSIPASVRLCALSLVCDSPWDLREELSSSLQLAASAIECQSLSEEDTELLLRCTIFHSALLQRETYKCSVSGKLYNWGHEDLLALIDAHIGIAHLCHDKTEALHYIAVRLVYGGHVLDPADLDVVESAALAYLSKELPLWFGGAHSNIISSLGNFDVTGSRHVLDHHLQGLLHSGDPLVLGFSADVAAEISKINSNNLSLLLQASQSPLGVARCVCTQLKQPETLPDYRHARDRLQALHSSLAQKCHGGGTNAGGGRHGPLLQFLQTEWDALHDSVSTLLSQLQRPRGRAPACGSLLELTNLSHLERRAELLYSYLRSRGTSGSYQLAAFKNARGLLLAVMRHAAQVQGKDISDMTPHLQVVSDSSASPLPDVVYLCGLELRGASWDAQHGALQEVVCLQMCSMPLVCVQARVKSINAARPTPRCEAPQKKDCSCVRVIDASPVTEPEFPLYRCPIYLDRDLESRNSGLADVNIITSVVLRTKLHPVLCGLRRVRLVSVL